MLNENSMVECWNAGGDLSPALRSSPITPPLHHSNPSRPLGLGLVEYSISDFSPSPGKSKNGKCRIVLHSFTASCFSPPLGNFVCGQKTTLVRRHECLRAGSLKILKFRCVCPGKTLNESDENKCDTTGRL